MDARGQKNLDEKDDDRLTRKTETALGGLIPAIYYPEGDETWIEPLSDYTLYE